jgi:lysophospholipase L1-like esterase
MKNNLEKKEKNWFDKNPKKTKLFTLIILFIVILFLTEFILYLKVDNGLPGVTLNERDVRLREYSPSINTYIHPTDEYMKRFNTKQLVQKKYRFRTDSMGFIMPSKIHEKPDIKIVFLGGSTTECGFVEEENRFPNLACRILEKVSGEKINSFNAGVSGANSMHSLNTLINKILPLNPNYVILMHNLNDLSTLVYTGTYWNESARSLILNQKKITFGLRIRRFIRKIIPHTYNAIKNLFSEETIDEWAGYRQRKISIPKEKILLTFKKSLETFICVCRTWDIRPVLMTQMNRFSQKKPSAPQYKSIFKNVNYSDYLEVYNRMNDVIRDTALANNVILIDLEKFVPREIKYMYDEVHLNDKGSILVSKIISNELKKVIR